MKQGLCSVVLEEAQRLSDAFRLLEGYLCLSVVNLLTLPANHLCIAVSGSKSSMEEPQKIIQGVSLESRSPVFLYPVHA